MRARITQNNSFRQVSSRSPVSLASSHYNLEVKERKLIDCSFVKYDALHALIWLININDTIDFVDLRHLQAIIM